MTVAASGLLGHLWLLHPQVPLSGCPVTSASSSEPEPEQHWDHGD